MAALTLTTAQERQIITQRLTGLLAEKRAAQLDLKVWRDIEEKEKAQETILLLRKLEIAIGIVQGELDATPEETPEETPVGVATTRLGK